VLGHWPHRSGELFKQAASRITICGDAEQI
jgi:hypothetical protein